MFNRSYTNLIMNGIRVLQKLAVNDNGFGNRRQKKKIILTLNMYIV